MSDRASFFRLKVDGKALWRRPMAKALWQDAEDEVESSPILHPVDTLTSN
jgi:hypothetical protein